MARSRTTFKKGRRYPNQGGRRENAGRKTNAEKEKLQKAAALSEKLSQEAEDYARLHMIRFLPDVVDRYGKYAKGTKSPPTTRHFMDKIIPPLSRVEGKQSVTFVTSLPVEEI